MYIWPTPSDHIWTYWDIYHFSEFPDAAKIWHFTVRDSGGDWCHPVLGTAWQLLAQLSTKL